MYQSFTLKYRPRTFEDVVGQEHVSRTIRNAVAAGHIHHAYLFTGPRGTGKTTTARVLARALNCVSSDGPTPNPCGTCPMCLAIGEGRAMDITEIDAASNNSVDDVRELREKVKYSPAEGRAKMYILDEVHMLSPGAFNALLKTLEEPPAHAYFALLTTELHKIPETIISRCQRFDFRPITTRDAAGALHKIATAEGLQVQDEALMAIARAAEGAMRDAQSIFEQVVAFSDGEITLAVVNQVLGVTEGDTLATIADIIARQDLPAVFSIVDQLVAQGKDLGRLIEDLTVFFRDLLRLALGSSAEAWLQLGAGGEERMRALATTIGSDRLLQAVHGLAELRTRMKTSSQHGLLLELALAELASAEVAAGRSAPVARRAAPAAAAAAPPAPAVAPAPAPAPPTPAAAPPVAPVPAVAPPPEPVPSAPAPAPEPEPSVAAAPTPAAPPVAPLAPVAAGELTCDVVAANWDNLISQLRRMGHMPVGAFLKDARPVAVADGCVTLSFPHKFHYSRVKSEYHQTVAKALEALFEQALRVECVLSEGPAGPPPAAGAVPGALAAPPPVAQPPVAQPPVAQPPVAQPPVAQPPVAQPPVAQPPPEAFAPPEDMGTPPDDFAPPPPEDPVPPAAPAPVAAPPSPVAAAPAPDAGGSLFGPAAAAPQAAAPEAPPRDPNAVGMTTDEAVAQTLSLFDGSHEVLPEPPASG